MKLFCKNNGFQYGTVGTDTNLQDKNREPLSVGDVVILKKKGHKWSKVRFVAQDPCANRFYVMGTYLESEVEKYDVELAIKHNRLSEGFGIGNVYYTKD